MTACGCAPPTSLPGAPADQPAVPPVALPDPCLPPLPFALLPELPPIEALRGSLLDGAPHPPSFYRDRVKSTVSRVANLALTQATGLQKWRFILTEAQQQRSGHSDAEHGIVFARILADPQATTASARVLWEIPGSPFEWVELQTMLPIGETVRFGAWSSPHPGRIVLEFELANSGPPSTVHLLVDLLARRRGEAFRRGHGLRDDTTFHLQPPPTDPHDPEPEWAPAGPKWPPRPPCAPRPPPTAPGCSCDLDGLPGEPKRIETCVPDPQILDWAPPSIANGEDDDGPSRDPEVVAGVAAGFDLRTLSYEQIQGQTRIYGRGPSGTGRVGILGNTGFDASRDTPELFATAGADLADHLRRCAPFTEIWHGVTQGLEQRRLDLENLDDIVLPNPSYVGETRRRGERLSAFAANGDGGPNAWQWTVTAPWLSQQYRVSWYLTELVNLLHATIDHIPKSLSVGRQGEDRNETVRIPNALDSIRGERGWNLRLRRSGNSRSDIRTILQVPPFASDFLHRGVLPFFERSDNANATAFPHMNRIRLHGGLVGAHLRPAQALYTVARQLTMAAAQADGEQRETLTSHASNVYRAYLGTLLPVAKTLLHELAHFDHGSHCKSGCAQERIAARWVRNVGEAFRPGWALSTGWNAAPSVVSLPHSELVGDAVGRGRAVCGEGSTDSRDHMAQILCGDPVSNMPPNTASRASRCRHDSHFLAWAVSNFGESGPLSNRLHERVRRVRKGDRASLNPSDIEEPSGGFRRNCTDDEQR